MITDDPGADKFGFTWEQARRHVARTAVLTPESTSTLVETLGTRLCLEPYQVVQMEMQDIEQVGALQEDER